MHRISIWLDQQPGCYKGMSLAYFLLNDQDKADFYRSTFWILSCYFPMSYSFVHTMWPTVVSLPYCKEWICWWLQFLNSLMKSNQHIYSAYEIKIWINMKFSVNSYFVVIWQMIILHILFITHFFPFILRSSPSLLSSSLSSSQITAPSVL